MQELSPIQVVKLNLAEVSAQIEAGYGLEDLVLAWDNGLAVKFSAPGQPCAVNPQFAECIVSPEQARKMPEEAWGYIPIVKNGHGQSASLIKRGAMLLKEKAKIEEILSWLEEKNAA